RHIGARLARLLIIGQVIIDDPAGQEGDDGECRKPRPRATPTRCFAFITFLVITIGAIIVLSRSAAALRPRRFFILEDLVDVFIVGRLTGARRHWRATAIIGEGRPVTLLAIGLLRGRQTRSAAIGIILTIDWLAGERIVTALHWFLAKRRSVGIRPGPRCEGPWRGI